MGEDCCFPELTGDPTRFVELVSLSLPLSWILTLVFSVWQIRRAAIFVVLLKANVPVLS